MGYEDGAIKIGQLTSIPLGYVGEQDTRTIRIDVRDWLNEYPGSLVMVQVVRPVDRYKYLAALTMENGIIAWTVGPGETDYAGKGLAQIVLYNPDTKQEYKSRVVGTLVGESLAGFNEALEASDPAKGWVDRVWQHAFESESAALMANLSATNAGASANRAKGYAEQAALSVDEFKKDAAPAIVQSGKSDIFAIHDSAERPLAGLRIYGKTTQNGTPTPSASVPLVNAGASGSIGVYARGKNLLDGRKWTDTSHWGLTYTNNSNGSITVRGTNEQTDYAANHPAVISMALQPGTYTLSGGSASAGCYIVLEYTVDGATHYIDSGRTFTIENHATANAYLQVAPGATVNATVYPQIELGASVTYFEPYKDGGSLTASTPGGLPGIPVGFGSGANIIDQWGQPWICDEIDFARGVYVQRAHVLDAASIAWNPNSINHAGDGYIFYTILYGTLSKRDMLSNRFRENRINASGSWDVLNVGEATVIVDDGNDFAYVILCMPGNINTADAINAYFAANPTTFLCAKKTPAEMPLPAEEVNAFHAMRSLKPTTSFFTDCGAEVAVDYIADTKAYINRIENDVLDLYNMVYDLDNKVNSSDGIRDPYTGKNYQLGVEHGKLILKEVTV